MRAAFFFLLSGLYSATVNAASKKENLDLFDPHCEDDGAKWYACPVTKSVKLPFAGCCKTDPCGSNSCALGNLAPVAFNGSMYGQLVDASCPSAGSTFFSCVNIPKNTTSFWGCCKSVACAQSGYCPKSDLTPASLDTKEAQVDYGALDEDASDDSDGKSHTGAIVGGAVGGAVAVIAIIAILIFCLYKKRKAKKAPAAAEGAPTDAQGREKTEYRHSTITEAPPLYTSPQPGFAKTFGGQHQYQQVAQAQPVEMPGDFTAGSSQRYSELPVEGHVAPPAELESPALSQHVSPRPSPKPMSSPRFTEGIEEERPRTRDSTYRISMGRLGSPK